VCVGTTRTRLRQPADAKALAGRGYGGQATKSMGLERNTIRLRRIKKERNRGRG